MYLMRIGAPNTRPHQILCTGLNHRDHAAETFNPTGQWRLTPDEIADVRGLGSQRQRVIAPR